MPTVVDKTVGGTSPDWSTFNGWEGDTDNDLVAADEVQRALCRDVDFGTVTSLFGATTDATRYREVTFDTGARYDPVAGTGARFQALQTAESNTHFTGIGNYNNGAGANICLGATGGVCTDVTVIDNATSSSTGSGFTSWAVMVNCLYYRTAGSGNGCQYGVSINGGALIDYCASYNARVTGFRNAFVSGHRQNSCISIGSGTSDFSGNAGTNSAKNISSDSTAPGTSPSTSAVATDVWTSPSTNDFTLKSGSVAIDYGDATYAPSADIIGTTRSSSHDCGPYDEASTAASGTTGTAASVSPGSTSAAVGTVTSSGVGASTSPGSTSAAVGTVTSVGAAASTSPGSESAGTGTVTSVGSAASVSPGSESAGTANSEATGTAASTSPGSESAGIGVVITVGSGGSTSPGSESAGTAGGPSSGTAASVAPGSVSAGVGVGFEFTPLIPISTIQMGPPPANLAQLVWWLERFKQQIVRLANEAGQNLVILDERTRDDG